MKRYIALLRGINISGKNKIAMVKLKQVLEELGYQDVKTYLNSGNVIFSCAMDLKVVSKQIREQIFERFALDIPVYVMAKEELDDVLHHAPSWWGSEDKEVYDNLIFILPPTTFTDVYEQLQEPKEGLEWIMNYHNVIFWSFVRKDYQKTNWWSKTASCPIGSQLTIRTANTVKRIVNM